MGGMQDHFQRKVEHFARIQHKLTSTYKTSSVRLPNNPLCAHEAWANTLDYRRFLRRRSVELYGLDVGHYGSIIFSEVLVPAEEEPSSWEDITPFYGSIEAITFAVFLVTRLVAKIQSAESSFAPC